MLAALVLSVLVALCALLLGRLSQRLDNDADSLIEQINHCLPQTQCGQCNYPGCRPYAEAIAAGSAAINQCPPGGDECVAQLAHLLQREVIPLDPQFGEHKPAQLARIIEADCIGCTLCIHACPVDAIVGASRVMHTVIAQECTGCELCLPPCPVDCIELVPLELVPQLPASTALYPGGAGDSGSQQIR